MIIYDFFFKWIYSSLIKCVLWMIRSLTLNLISLQINWLILIFYGLLSFLYFKKTSRWYSYLFKDTFCICLDKIINKCAKTWLIFRIFKNILKLPYTNKSHRSLECLTTVINNISSSTSYKKKILMSVFTYGISQNYLECICVVNNFCHCFFIIIKILIILICVIFLIFLICLIILISHNSHNYLVFRPNIARNTPRKKYSTSSSVYERASYF